MQLMGAIKMKEFEGKIASCAVYPSVKGPFRQWNPPYIFTFTKNRVLFHKKEQEHFGAPGITLNFGKGDYFLKHEDKYKLITLAEGDDARTANSKFQIVLENGCSLNLIVNWWNLQKLYWIHGRTLLQKNAEWLIKLIIAGLIASAITLFFTKGCACTKNNVEQNGRKGALKTPQLNKDSSKTEIEPFPFLYT
jgi:hypothetical protein